MILKFKEMNMEGMDVEKSSDKIFMNDISSIKLRENFFTHQIIGGITVEERKNNYN
jgi:hypothetical protein